MYSGWLEYESDSALAFRIAHFSHSEQSSNLWLLLGTGPWNEEDDTGCWVVIRSWVADGDLTLRIEDAEDSPFDGDHISQERFLSRKEVLDQSGGLEWAVARRDDLLALHNPSFEFLELNDTQ